MNKMPTLVSVNWLADNLPADNLTIIDGSWYLPTASRDPHKEFLDSHIPGAVFFDIDAIADHSTGLPHMMPTEEQFAAALAELGIDADNQLVVYDGAGLFSAARVRWMLRVIGAKNVAILNGGMPAWRGAGQAIEEGKSGKSSIAPRKLTIDYSKIVSLSEMKDIVARGEMQVLDARPAARFHGQAPEPRPGVRSGHMPNAISWPASDVVENGLLKSNEELRVLVDEAEIDLSGPIVTSCGSGVTAATLLLALEQLGHDTGVLYDGSWSEWGGRDDTNVITDD